MVSGGVTHRVVDVLEPVEVDVQRSKLEPQFAAPAAHFPHLIREKAAVSKACQIILQGFLQDGIVGLFQPARVLLDLAAATHELRRVHPQHQPIAILGKTAQDPLMDVSFEFQVLDMPSLFVTL